MRRTSCSRWKGREKNMVTFFRMVLNFLFSPMRIFYSPDGVKWRGLADISLNDDRQWTCDNFKCVLHNEKCQQHYLKGARGGGGDNLGLNSALLLGGNSNLHTWWSNFTRMFQVYFVIARVECPLQYFTYRGCFQVFKDGKKLPSYVKILFSTNVNISSRYKFDQLAHTHNIQWFITPICVF